MAHRPEVSEEFRNFYRNSSPIPNDNTSMGYVSESSSGIMEDARMFRKKEDNKRSLSENPRTVVFPKKNEAETSYPDLGLLKKLLADLEKKNNYLKEDNQNLKRENKKLKEKGQEEKSDLKLENKNLKEQQQLEVKLLKQENYLETKKLNDRLEWEKQEFLNLKIEIKKLKEISCSHKNLEEK